MTHSAITRAITRPITRPMCPICGQHLTARDRGPHQQWLEREYVCLDIDCLEFGVYKAESTQAS